MKKSELESHRAEYDARMNSAQAAAASGLFRPALDAAMSAWDYIDGMMQYGRKYESKELASISAIDFVLQYAPLLLDSRCLDKLEHLLAEKKCIQRGTTEDQAACLAKSREQIHDNYRLWSHLEANPESRQDELRRVLGGDQDYWRSVAEAWQKMGLVRRTPDGGTYRLALTTRLGQIVSSKCPCCGEIAEAPKAMLLTKTKCPKCDLKVLFVLRPLPG